MSLLTLYQQEVRTIAEGNIPLWKQSEKSLFEWFLNLCGYKIWPKTHSDPRIKGPPLRILTKEQVKEFERMERTR